MPNRNDLLTAGSEVLHGQAMFILFSSVWSLSTSKPPTRWVSSSVEISQWDGIWKFYSFPLFLLFLLFDSCHCWHLNITTEM